MLPGNSKQAFSQGFYPVSQLWKHPVSNTEQNLPGGAGKLTQMRGRGGGVAMQRYEVCGRRSSVQWWADSPQVSFAMETRQVCRLLGLIVITSTWSATHGWAHRTTCLCLFLLLPHTAFCSRFACAATSISPPICCWPPGPSSWGSKHPYQSPSWAPRRSMCLLISLTETRCWPWTPPPSEEVRASECHQIPSLNYWKLNDFCFIGETQLLALPAVSILTLRPRSISNSGQSRGGQIFILKGHVGL